MNVSPSGRWSVERVLDPSILPIEVWNLEFGPAVPGAAGTLLYQVVGSQRLDALRSHCRSAREAGEILGADIARALRHLVEQGLGGTEKAQAVYLGGGLLNSDGLRDRLQKADLPVPVVLSDDPTFCAGPGGKELLSQHGDGRGIVLDVGQTSIKAIAHSRGRARQLVFPRDHHSLPLHLQELDTVVPPSQAQLYVERAAGFIARAVHGFAAIREPPPPLVVLALPSKLSDDGTPHGCTYPGWDGSVALVPRITGLLDEWIQADHGHPWRTAQGRILLLNDTELTARSARIQSSIAASRVTLVVSLGFGPGAALLHPAKA